MGEGNSRRELRKEKRGQVTKKGRIIFIRCNSPEQLHLKNAPPPHRVFIGDKGDIVLLDHPYIPFKALASEHSMREQSSKDCAAFIANVMTSTQAHTNNFGDAIIEQIYQKRIARSITRREGMFDPLEQPMMKRAPLILGTASDVLLKECTFRTTESFGHKILIHGFYKGETRITAKGVAPGVTKNGKATKAAIKRTMLLSVALNAPKWARAYLLCGGVVEKKFVISVFKEKSENELYVNTLRQSVGYTLVVDKTIIRRAHDGVWRIHKVVDSWP